MKILFSKISTFVWTIFLFFFIGKLVYYISPGQNFKENFDIIIGFVSIIGIFFVAIQMQAQKKDSIISTEFLNQPNFEFLGFCNHDEKIIFNSSPKLCSCDDEKNLQPNFNNCIDIHWFDIKQIGKLPAQKIQIILICEDEKDNILFLLKSRSKNKKMLYIDDKYQFKLPPEAVPLKYYNGTKNGTFFILVEYISIYSKIKYKRVYELEYAPLIINGNIPKTWSESIRFFDINLFQLSDSRTITTWQIFKSILNKILIKITLKKTMTIEEWAIDI